MEKEKNKIYEGLILLLLIILFFGYFGLFSLLSNYVYKGIIYLIILFIWTVAMKKYIKNGIENFKKEYFNDALSIVTGIFIISAVLLLFLSKIDKGILITKPEEIEIVPLMLFSSLIFAPIVEELVFRCALGLFVEKIIKNDIVINIITAILFSFLHLFKMQLNIVGIIFYGIIYYMLGYALRILL